MSSWPHVPPQPFSGGALTRCTGCLTAKPYSFPGKVLLELLMNHFCLSRGDASMLLGILCVLAASPWLVSSERAGFPWKNVLFGSDGFLISWLRGQIPRKLTRSVVALWTEWGTGGCFT